MRDFIGLIRRAQQGDLESFGEIVKRFKDMAVGYAVSLLGDFHLAEDAAQEAFLQAYRDLATLKEPAAFPAWFRRIVFKHCDRLTRKKRVSTVPLDFAKEPEERALNPSDVVERRGMRDTVLQSIHSLPEHERTATTLFYIDGYSLQEVGEFLEIPATTVKSRLHSARKRLKERIVNMVDRTLKQHAPGAGFDARIRSVLLGVPIVSFELHRRKEQKGPSRCPESFMFPSCVRAYLEFVGEDLDSTVIEVEGRSWRLDRTYTFLMGTTGAAFKLSWKPGWYLGNPALSLVSENPDEPYQRGIESLGYAYEIVHKTPTHTEADFRRRIVAHIQSEGKPLVAKGVVGPPVECILTGFDQEGRVLIGWSHFQKFKEFKKDLRFERNGYFRKRNWFEGIQTLIFIRERKSEPRLEEVYQSTLAWAVQIAQRPAVEESHNGLAAYQAWEEAILQEREFTDKQVKDLRLRYDVHHDAVGTIAEGRWYATRFLDMLLGDVSAPKKELEQARACYDEEHKLMWQLWGLVGGPGSSNKKAKAFADPGIRKPAAALIRQSKDQYQRAAEHLQAALQSW